MAFVLTGLLEKITIHLKNNYFYMAFNMKEPVLKNDIDEFKPIFKSCNEVSQQVSMKYGANSFGEMAFWNDESWSFYLHDIYTTRHCRTGQRYINITRNAIGPKSGQKDCRKF